jgi:hypothetical protein
MRDNISDLANWPKTHGLQPILKSTNEAFLYAQLIYAEPDKQQDLCHYRVDTYKKLKAERERERPNINNMFALAVRAQFFREAFEECLRIKDENSKAIGG